MGQAKKKQRDCPAVGRTISAAECGENRASRYVCPADCPHNPWNPAHYEQSLAIEDAALAATYRRLAIDRGGPLPQFEIDQITNATDLGRQMHFIKVFLLDRDGQGRTFMERWAVAGFAGLNNDERNFAQWKAQARVRLLEIRRVGATGHCEAADLLDAARGPLHVQDRSLHAQAVRFAQLLGWVFETPHYTRVLGVALTVPEVSILDGDDVVRMVVEHLGGPIGGEELQGWLAANFLKMEQAFGAINAAFRYQMMKHIDARFTKTTYRLRGGRDEVLRRLDEWPAVRPEPPAPAEEAEGFTEGRVWFDETAPVEAGQGELALSSIQSAIAGRPALGRVLVAADRIRLEAGSGARAQALRALFEKAVGRWVRFQEERVDDLGAQMLKNQPPPDLTWVPPTLLEHAPRIVLTSSRLEELPAGTPLPEAELYAQRRHDELFLNDTIPVLNGRTPRQAASDPALRPLLVRMMKQRLRGLDRRNQQTGETYDANWLVRELGLTEILIDPPPPRPVPPEMAEDLAAEDEWLDESLPASPPLPAQPFTEQQLATRLHRALEALPDPGRAVIAFQDAAPHVCELLETLTPEQCTDAESMVLLVLAAQVWFVFAPPGTRGWRLDGEQLEEHLFQPTTAAVTPIAPPDLERLIHESRQPELARHVADLLAQTVDQGPKKLRTDPVRALMLLFLLWALIDELDRAARLALRS